MTVYVMVARRMTDGLIVSRRLVVLKLLTVVSTNSVRGVSELL